jgi:hypothetical protein
LIELNPAASVAEQVELIESNPAVSVAEQVELIESAQSFEQERGLILTAVPSRGFMYHPKSPHWCALWKGRTL